MYASSIRCSAIAKSVISRCALILDKKKGKSCVDVSLKDLLCEISDVIPETTRRFGRVLALKPENVLEILLGFQVEYGRVAIETRKIESLWGIFIWANEQNKCFKHLPQSCEVMASMLFRAGMLNEIELLLSRMENGGVSLDNLEIFSNLIEGYVGDRQLERALSVYGRIRGCGLVPSLSCHIVLLDLLIGMKKHRLVFQVCLDVVDMGIKLNDAGKATLENAIILLCSNGRIQEARSLVKKLITLGFQPSILVLNEIACGYCEKKNFKDLLSFFVEIKHAPDILPGNKVIFTLCSMLGSERADVFRQELELLGFRPDEKTFGILIDRSCRECNLKRAFIYLSELLSRSLRPEINCYNSLISGVFKVGMWKNARDILDEMVDKGITPNLSTFRILLAGYCKARQFSEAKTTVCEMANHGLIQLSSQEDPLCKVFRILELNPLAVRVKRDNDVGFSRTEFSDNLGNGLYLDTDLDEFEKKLTWVLEDSLIPDFNSLVLKESFHGKGNLRTALMLVEEMVSWGQELYLLTFSALVRGLCQSCSNIKAISNLIEKRPKLVNQLDEESLNLLVQAYSKKGLTYKGRIILDGMLQRHVTVKNETYTALIIGLFKQGNLKDLKHCWLLAHKDNWLPVFEDLTDLVGSLCQHEMVKEALELSERMLVTYPHMRSSIWDMILEKLCATGFTSIAHVLFDQILQKDFFLDPMAYSHLIRGLCKEKNISEAFMIFDIMQAKKLPPSWDASVLLIPHLCMANSFKKATLLKEISLRNQSSLSLSVHSALMKGLCRAGNVGEAANLFKDMLSKGLNLDAEFYNMMVQGHCRASNSRKVRDLLGAMIRRHLSLSLSSYRNLVSLMCMEGKVLQALCLKELMLGQSKSFDLVIYNILIFYLFQTRNSFHVNMVLDELRVKNLVLDEVTYNFLVYGFGLCKDMSTSQHYLSAMISEELKPSDRNLRTVIGFLCDVGEIGKAMEVSQEMELRGWVHGSVIQNAIVDGLLSQGKLQEAETFLDRMVKKCLIPDKINYDNLIKQFCWYGRLTKAVDLLNIMLKKRNVPNSTSYDSVIHGFCIVNKLDQAMDFHTEMLEKGLKPNIETWGVLVDKFCQNGQTEDAKRLLFSMDVVGEIPTREIYCSVINRYCFENNHRKASELIKAMQQSGHEPDFEMHWSLISNLSNSNNKDSSTQGFLSRLLSQSGFAQKMDTKN